MVLWMRLDIGTYQFRSHIVGGGSVCVCVDVGEWVTVVKHGGLRSPLGIVCEEPCVLRHSLSLISWSSLSGYAS